MPKRIREVHRPADLSAASELLRRTDLRAAPLLLGPRPPLPPTGDAEAVVDLSQLELDYIIDGDDGAVHLGALMPLQDLADSRLLKSLANGLLSDAARLSAHLGLRNAATVGGVLFSREGPPEVLLALLALDTTVVVRSDDASAREVVEVNVADLAPQRIALEPQHGEAETTKTREIPLAGFQPNALASGELVVEVKFERPAAQTGGALERVARAPRDEAIVAAAAVVEAADGVCRKARLAIAGAGRPQRMSAAENILEGRPLNDTWLQKAVEAVEADVNPVSDFRASAEYRRAMAGVLAWRALERARGHVNH
jgi:CO/xanthine dehydrogenase FAD-binding subunit